MAKRKQKTLWVEILEAKPNKLFTEAQRQAVRFLRYSRRIPCTQCKKKRKIMWTMLCEFKAQSMGHITLVDGETIHPPLTPVCDEHPLQPHLED